MVLGAQSMLIISLISFIVSVPISAGILVLSGKIFKQEIGYVKSLLAAFIIGAAGLLLSLPSLYMAISNIPLMIIVGIVNFLVGVALYLTLPRFIHGLEWKSALLVGLVWWVGMIIVGIILGLVVTAILLAVGISAFAGGLSGGLVE